MLGHVPGKTACRKSNFVVHLCRTTIDHHGSAHVWHCPGNAVSETVFALILSIGSSCPPKTNPWLCDRARKYHRGDAIIDRSAPNGIAFHRTSSHGVLCDRSIIDSASFSSSPGRGSPIRYPSSRESRTADRLCQIHIAARPYHPSLTILLLRQPPVHRQRADAGVIASQVCLAPHSRCR